MPTDEDESRGPAGRARSLLNDETSLLRRQRDVLLGFVELVASWCRRVMAPLGLAPLSRPLPPVLPEAVRAVCEALRTIEGAMRALQVRARTLPAAPLREVICDWPPCGKSFLLEGRSRKVTCSRDCHWLRHEWLVRNRLRVFGLGRPRENRHLVLRDLPNFDPNL